MARLASSLKAYGAQSLNRIKTVEEAVFCPCGFSCAFKEMVFPGKDKSSILFSRIVNSDTISFELLKNGAKVADIVDNSYGDYYDTFAAKPLYKGLVIDWEKVKDLHGFGEYQIKTVIVSLAQTIEEKSRIFRLLPFSEKLAHNTVKIKAIQLGNIVQNNLDFTNLLPGGWPFFLRLPGTFTPSTPEIESERYLTSNYELMQNYDTVREKYLLTLLAIEKAELNKIVANFALANYLEITQSNYFEKEEVLEVIPESFANLQTLGQGKYKIEMNLTKRTQNLIKRNL